MAEYIRIGKPANEAEREGFRLLRDRLPDHFVVLGNFDLRVPNRRTSIEYDAVIIGEYGFYAVEIKGWTGLIRGGDKYWELPWERRDNPLRHLDRKTKILGQFIRRRVDALAQDCFFAPTMFFPREGVKFELPGEMMKSIAGPHSVYDHFVDMELVRRKGPGPFRDRDETQKIVDAIVSSAEPGDDGVSLSYYDVEGERQIDVGDQPYREFIGSHQYLKNRGKVRIKAYTMDPLATPTDRREEKNRVLRDLEALEVLEDNSYVARPYDMQPDEDDQRIFYLISEWVGARTLKEWIMEHDDHRERRQYRRELAGHLVEAVASIHDEQIVHRNLSPYVIYLTEDTAGVPFKIADFDFARVSKLESIAEALSHIGTDGYKAPELWLDEDYDHRLDIFALGAILFEVLTGEVLFLGPGALLQPEKAWCERREMVVDEGLRPVIGGMVSKDLQRRSEAFAEAREQFGAVQR